jgi:hypothetical protein
MPWKIPGIEGISHGNFLSICLFFPVSKNFPNSHHFPQQGIFADDAGRSVQGIQTALYEDFPGQKFLVSCALAGAENAAKSDGAVAAKGGSTVLPAKVHFASSGDAYCNIQARKRNFFLCNNE